MASQELELAPLDISLTVLWPEVKVLTSLYLLGSLALALLAEGGGEEGGWVQGAACLGRGQELDLKACSYFLSEAWPAQPVAPQGFGSGTQECLQRIYLVAFGTVGLPAWGQTLT